MNFADCQQYVVDLLDDMQFGYFTRPQVKQWLNFAQREVQRMLLQANQNYYVICSQTTLVVGQPDYGLPSGFLKTHQGRVITGGNYPNESYVDLAPVTIQQAAQVVQQNGCPSGYFITRNKMFFDRPPDQPYLFKLRWSYLVADMVLDSEVPDVPEQYVELVPMLAIKLGFLKDRRTPSDIDEKIKLLTLSMAKDATNRQQDTPRRVRTYGRFSHGGTY